MGPRVLAVGGAGYVGSHCVRRLLAEGCSVEVLDDLSTGHADSLPDDVLLHRCDLRDEAGVDEVVARGFDLVLHFAGLILVGESVRRPLEYFDVNVTGSIHLLRALRTHGTPPVVFSSTAAVYGAPEHVPIAEDHRIAPVNPYGDSKVAIERLLSAARDAYGLRSACLRYFNAAGAAADGTIGEAHPVETHLIPLTLEAASGERRLKVYGTDYETRDGTCVRDYVHVEDLAAAHWLAAAKLLDGGTGGAWNLGTGDGNTVREVLDAVARVTGREVPADDAPRRAGDPPILVADASRAHAELGWRPEHSLDDIVASAWRWHQAPRFGPRARE